MCSLREKAFGKGEESKALEVEIEHNILPPNPCSQGMGKTMLPSERPSR